MYSLSVHELGFHIHKSIDTKKLYKNANYLRQSIINKYFYLPIYRYILFPPSLFLKFTIPLICSLLLSVNYYMTTFVPEACISGKDN